MNHVSYNQFCPAGVGSRTKVRHSDGELNRESGTSNVKGAVARATQRHVLGVRNKGRPQHVGERCPTGSHDGERKDENGIVTRVRCITGRSGMCDAVRKSVPHQNIPSQVRL